MTENLDKAVMAYTYCKTIPNGKYHTLQGTHIITHHNILITIMVNNWEIGLFNHVDNPKFNTNIDTTTQF